MIHARTAGAAGPGGARDVVGQEVGRDGPQVLAPDLPVRDPGRPGAARPQPIRLRLIYLTYTSRLPH